MKILSCSLSRSSESLETCQRKRKSGGRISPSVKSKSCSTSGIVLFSISRTSPFWLPYASPRGNNFIKKSDSSRAWRKERRAAMFVLAYKIGVERSWAGQSLAGVIVTRNCCPFVSSITRLDARNGCGKEGLVGGAREKTEREKRDMKEMRKGRNDVG